MTEQRPTASELAGEVRDAYERLRALTDRSPTSADGAGGWSTRQLLAHVAFWDRFQTDRLQRALAGESAPTVLDEEMHAVEENAARAADERRSEAEILAESEAARAALIAFVESLSEEVLHAPYAEGDWPLSLVRLIRQVGVRHVRGHARSLGGD